MSSQQSIAELAYELWIARGRPHGSAEADWLEAERRLAGTSDVEVAPSNARARWAATPEPPVDETDDAPATAWRDIGEG